MKEKNLSVLVFNKWRDVGWHMSSTERSDRNNLIHLATPTYKGVTMTMGVMISCETQVFEVTGDEKVMMPMMSAH